MNKVFLIGNIGRNLDLKTTQSGASVLNTAVATNERRKGSDGNWFDHTEWHNVVVFGKTAENMANFCQKGSKVAVEGKLQTRDWEKKDGTKAYTTEIIASAVEFLTPKSIANDLNASAEMSAVNEQQANNNDIDDIPF